MRCQPGSRGPVGGGLYPYAEVDKPGNGRSGGAGGAECRAPVTVQGRLDGDLGGLECWRPQERIPQALFEALACTSLINHTHARPFVGAGVRFRLTAPARISTHVAWGLRS